MSESNEIPSQGEVTNQNAVDTNDHSGTKSEKKRGVLETWRRRRDNQSSVSDDRDVRSEGQRTVFERLFERDRTAEEEAPELLKGAPYFKLENLLDTLPSAQEAEGIKIETIGIGENGLVVRLIGEKDLAIKLYFNAFTSSELRKVFKKISLNEKDRREILKGHQYNPDFSEKQALTGAGGNMLGNFIAPDYVNEIDGIFTFQGKPIGFSMSTIEGEETEIDDDDNDEKYVEAKMRLERGGILLDRGAKHAIRYLDTDGVPKTKLIDLTASLDYLDHDPRIVHPGEYWVRRLGTREGTQILYNQLTYEELQKRIAAFDTQHSESRSRVTPYTFEDELTGAAVKTSETNYVEYQRIVKVWSNFADLLRGHNVDLNKGAFTFTEDEVRYMNVLQDESSIEPSDGGSIVAQVFSANYTEDAIGSEYYFYKQTTDDGKGNGKIVKIKFEDGILSYDLWSKDREMIITVNPAAPSYSFSPQGSQPRIITSGEETTTLQSLRDTLGINDLSEPREVFSSILDLLPQKAA
jgi:hypothetical protein